MKFFKMTTLVTLVFAAAAQSAFAVGDVGRITSVEKMTASSFKCEKIAAEELKRQTASVDLRETDRKVEQQTGTVKSSM